MTPESVEVEIIARVMHNVNCAYVNNLDPSSKLLSWEASTEAHRHSLRTGVVSVLSGAAKTLEEQHQNWMAIKIAEGWIHGAVKDEAAKTHPCLMPYGELPAEQRVKKAVFRAVVREVAGVMGYGF